MSSILSSRLSGLASLVLVGLATSDASAAAAAEIAVVGVHVSGMDDAAATEASERLVAALADTGRLTPVVPGDVSASIAGREKLVVDQAFLGPGKAALDEGRILYERAEFDDAIASLEHAVSLLTEAMPAATDNRLLIDALLMQGLTHFSIGDNDPARDAFEQVALLDPSRRLDPVNYSGPTVAFFDEARAAVEGRGVGALAVEGDPGSAVYVDGRSRGETPVRVEALAAGEHTVLVVGPQGRRAFQEVTIAAGRTEKVQPVLARGFLAEAGGDEAARARQTEQLYRALGTYVGTDLVLVAGQTEADEVAVQLYEPRTGNFSKIFRASGDDPITDLADGVVGLAGFLDDSGGLRTDKVYPRAAPLDIGTNVVLLSMLLDPEPIVTEVFVGAQQDGGRGVPWYVWAGVGAVAAGGVATTAVLLTTGDGEPSANGTITVGPMP